MQRQDPALAAVTASIALKSPPQFYHRELVAHCIKAAEALKRSIPRLVEDLKRATKQSGAVGELQSERNLQSGDVILRFDTTGSRDSWRRCQDDWIKILGVGAHLKERHCTVLIHSMQTQKFGTLRALIYSGISFDWDKACRWARWARPGYGRSSAMVGP